MPDFKAEASSTGSRDSVLGSDVGAPERSGKVDAKVIVGLVAAAVVVKFFVFGLSVGTSMSLSVPNAENWQDFSLAYAPAVAAFRSGFMPYADFFYPYPPPFLWVLTAFSYLPLPQWSSAIPLIGADALTVVPLYLVAREIASERTARMVSFIFIFSPMNLYYVDYLWLNPSLTTLFLMGSVYLLVKKRFGLSAISLALSIGLKQTALIAVPIILLVMWKSGAKRFEAVKYLASVAVICVAFSIPYLVTSPTLYLDSILRVPMGMWPPLNPAYFQVGAGVGTRVTFDTLNWITSRWVQIGAGVNGPVTLILPLFLFLMPSSQLGVYDSSLLSDAAWFFLAVGFLLLLIVTRWKPKVSLEQSWKYILCAMLFAFTLYPLYKYYVVGIVPFMILIVRDRKGAFGFLGFSLAFMLTPRYFDSWVLLAAFVWLFRQDLRRLLARGAKSLVSPFARSLEDSPGRDRDDVPLSWRGRPISRRAWFGVAALLWFALFLSLIWPRIVVLPGLGLGSAGFFLTGAVSAVYLAKFGPSALSTNSQNMLWLGMLWGYDFPYVVVASLVFSGLLRF